MPWFSQYIHKTINYLPPFCYPKNKNKIPNLYTRSALKIAGLTGYHWYKLADFPKLTILTDDPILPTTHALTELTPPTPKLLPPFLAF